MIALVKPSIPLSNSELLGGGTYRVDQNQMKKVRQFKSVLVFWMSFFFGREKLYKSALQRHRILNEDNLVLLIRYVFNFEAFIFREI